MHRCSSVAAAPPMQEVMGAHLQHAPSRSARRPQAPAESGFSTLELIIAMAITLILLGAAVTQFRGSKQATYAADAKAAGSAYAQAISQFQADNGNRNPTGMTAAGPMDLLNKPYLREQPEGVAGGRIAFSATCAAAGGSTVGFVAYCPGTEPEFGIRVQWRASPEATWNTGCWLGRTAATPRC